MASYYKSYIWGCFKTSFYSTILLTVDFLAQLSTQTKLRLGADIVVKPSSQLKSNSSWERRLILIFLNPASHPPTFESII